MSRIAVVGGHGKIARHLHRDLVAHGHLPIALARREEYRPALADLGAELRLLDIENDGADAFAAAFAGCEAIVFTAGGGPDGDLERKRTVDLEGSLKSIAAAQELGITRFVQVSAINVDEPVPADAEAVWRAYVEAKRDADIALRESGLLWTILRPGTLTDGPPTGHITLAEKVEPGEISRADVAGVLAAVLDRPSTIGSQWELVNGSTPILDALG